MSYKIALISAAQSFIAEAVAKGLKAEHVETLFYSMTPKEIESLSGQQMILFLSLDELAAQNKVVLEIINNLCLNEKMQLYVMGYGDQIATAKNYLSEKAITAEYRRPINTKNVVEGIMSGLGLAELRAKKKIVLLVDDSGQVLHTFKEILEPTYTVYMCNSGREALTFLRGRKPDLILLDHEMPSMSGPETLAKIHENPTTAHIPVMFLTGKSDKDSVMSAASQSPQGYLLKTMSANQIMERLADFFDSQYKLPQRED